MPLPYIIQDPGKVWKCTVRGHDHNLDYLRSLQTNAEKSPFGYLYECPTGNYRYLIFPEDTIPGGDFHQRRIKRPRWGW